MSLTVTSAYAGGFAGMVERLLNEVEGVKLNLFRVAEGKFKTTFGKISSSNISQLYRSTPIDRGTATVTEKILTHTDFMYYLEFNPISQFRQFWVPEVMNPNDFVNLPAEVQQVLLNEFLRAAGDNFNDTMFQGPTTATEALPFTGLKANMLADADVLDVSTPTTITATNAITELDRVRQKATAKMKAAPGFAYMVSYTWLEFLIEKQSQTAATNTAPMSINYDAEGKPVVRYWGKPVYGMTGLAADTAIAGVCTNDSRGNFAIAWEGDMMRQPRIGRVQENSDDWFFRLDMSADVDVITGADAVLYGT